MKYNKRKGFFCKEVKRWEVSLLNRGKARGFWAYCPVLFLPPRWETGEGRRSSAAADSAALGHGGGRGEGEKGAGGTVA